MSVVSPIAEVDEPRSRHHSPESPTLLSPRSPSPHPPPELPSIRSSKLLATAADGPLEAPLRLHKEKESSVKNLFTSHDTPTSFPAPKSSQTRTSRPPARSITEVIGSEHVQEEMVIPALVPQESRTSFFSSGSARKRRFSDSRWRTSSIEIDKKLIELDRAGRSRATELERMTHFENDVKEIWPLADPRQKIAEMDQRYEPEGKYDSTIESFRSDPGITPADRPDKRVGSIRFKNGKVAWYYRVEKSQIDYSTTGTIPKKLVEFVSRNLRYPYPKLLVSVVGGAQDFHLPKTMEAHLKRGLRKTIEATEAWIVTGGTDCGVMRYVGQVISEIDQTIKNVSRRPVIGFAPFGVLGAKEELKRGGRVNNIEGLTWSDNKAKNQELNSNHNVFIFYDDDSSNFGTELPLRGDFEGVMSTTVHSGARVQPTDVLAAERQSLRESSGNNRRQTRKLFRGSSNRVGTVRRRTMSPTSRGHSERTRPIFSSTMKIFSVVLVVEGGLGTLKGIKASLQQRIPAVVVEGSGRAADVISYAWKLLHDKHTESRRLTDEGLTRLIRKVIFNGRGKETEIMKCKKMVLGLVQVKSQVTIYSANDSVSLDQVILQALMRAHILMLEDKRSAQLASIPGLASYKYRLNQQFLYLSLMFNHIEEAKEALRVLQSREMIDVSELIQHDLEEALIWSLLNARFDFVVALCPLVKNLYGFLYQDNCKNLEVLFSVDRNIYLKPHVLHMFNWNRRLLQQKIGSHQKQLNADVPSVPLITANKFIAQAMLPASASHSKVAFLGSECQFEIAGRESPASVKLRNNHAYLDLLIWSILFGHAEHLATWMWEQGGNSTGVALFASKLLRSLATSSFLAGKEQFRTERKAMAAMSDEFEELAVGVLEECSVDDYDLTRKLLELDFYFVRDLQGTQLVRNAISLAVAAEQTEFLSHPAALAVLEQKWFGEIDQETSLFAISVSCLCPILLLQHRVLRVSYSINEGKTDSERYSLSFWWKVWALYSSPIGKFFLDLVSHIILLTVYTIVALSDIPSRLEDADILLLIWMSALTMDEIGDVMYFLSEAGHGIKSALRAYFKDWTAITLFAIILYWIVMFLRLSAEPTSIMEIKLLYGISVSLFWLETLRFYTMSATLGPKVVMLARMLKDIYTFVALFFIFMMTYGVFSEVMLQPLNNGYGQSPDVHTFGRITYRPFFQIFGELFLDDIAADTRCLGPESFQGCDYQAVLPVITGVYCLVANIVLVNLLIAMMAKTYEIVQKQTLQIWNLKQHHLVLTYEEKSIFPTPLSLVTPFSRACGLMLKCCGYKSNKAVQHETAISWKNVDLSSLWSVEMFQEKNTDSYFLRRIVSKSAESPIMTALATLNEFTRSSLSKVQQDLEKVHIRIQYSNDRIEREFSINQSARNSHHIHSDFLSNFARGYVSSPDRQAGVQSRYKELLFMSFTVGNTNVYYTYLDPHSEQPHRKQNLVVTYQGEKDLWAQGEIRGEDLREPRLPSGKVVKRLEVSVEHRPWNQVYAAYHPESYTSPFVLYFGIDVDVAPEELRWAESHDVSKAKVSRPHRKGATPNMLTGSKLPVTFNDDGFPLNPIGRTGLKGRGVLAKWGPNRAHYYILRRPIAQPVERCSQQVGEVFLVQRKDGQWVLPGGFVDQDEILEHGISEAAHYKLLRRLLGLPEQQSDQIHHTELERLLIDAHSNPLNIVCSDDRDTDNAWIEPVHFELDLTKLGMENAIQPAEIPEKGYRFDWVVLHRDIDIAYRSHRNALEHIASMYDLYW